MRRIHFKRSDTFDSFAGMGVVSILGFAFSVAVGFFWNSDFYGMSSVFVILGTLSAVGVAISFERVKQ